MVTVGVCAGKRERAPFVINYVYDGLSCDLAYFHSIIFSRQWTVGALDVILFFQLL